VRFVYQAQVLTVTEQRGEVVGQLGQVIVVGVPKDSRLTKQLNAVLDLVAELARDVLSESCEPCRLLAAAKRSNRC